MTTSIARRRTFADLRRHGRRARSGPVRLSFLPLQTTQPQVGFAIGRSFGSAVERNRGRRRLRAAFLEALGGDGTPDRGEAFPGLEGAFLLTGSRGLLTERYDQLVANVRACLTELEAAVVSETAAAKTK
ncbi:MAG: ribonuclease P protein component [Acidimicrobiales bacterium]